MKFMIVLAAVAAVALASPGAVFSPYAAYNGLYNGANFGYSYSAPALAYSAAPALGYSALPYNYGYTGYNAPLAYSAVAPVAVAAPVAVKSQYHAQDELGQASYGHAEAFQTHNAVQDAHGNKIGSYSYVAPDGQVIRADYVADAGGFRVASNALPVGPTALPVGPAPVQDVPEVVAARAAHLAEVEAVKSRTKRGAIAVGHLPAATAPLAYASAIHAAPLAYSAYNGIHAPLAYSAYNGIHAAPLAYSAYNGIHAPLAYSAYNGIHAAPLAYSAAPVAVAAAPVNAVREATLTQIVNNPGHAVSYRVD